MPISLVVCSPEQATDIAVTVVLRSALRITPYRRFEFGAATGKTPIPFYRRFVELGHAAKLNFGQVQTWNLDEYVGLPAEHPQSYRTYMQTHLHGPAGIPEKYRRFPSSVDPEDYDSRLRFETEASGIDIGILGLGRTGHIGFCEPGSPRSGKTSRVTLHRFTREDAASDFGGVEHTPEEAVTMGIDTILTFYSRIILMAFGEAKSDPVAAMLQGPIGPSCPGSFLREHPDVLVLIDPPAAAKLSPRFVLGTAQ